MVEGGERRRRGHGHQPSPAQRRHPSRHARRDRGRPDRHAARRAGLPCRLPAAAPAGLAPRPGRRPVAASSSTSPCTTPTRCASCSATIPSRSSRFSQSAGMAKAGLEDGVMGVAALQLGRDRPVPRRLHHEIRRDRASRCMAREGSLIGRNVMTQQADRHGDAAQRGGRGRTAARPAQSLRAGSRAFHARDPPARASRPRPARMASGRWPPRLAVVEAAKTGTRRQHRTRTLSNAMSKHITPAEAAA